MIYSANVLLSYLTIYKLRRKIKEQRSGVVQLNPDWEQYCLVKKKCNLDIMLQIIPSAFCHVTHGPH